MHEKLSSHFRVKSRENEGAHDDEQWVRTPLARNTGRLSSCDVYKYAPFSPKEKNNK